LAPSTPARWLLIGNSRWHWAESHGNGLRIWHSSPGDALAFQPDDLKGWAAAGALRAAHPLPQQRRVQLPEVPLRDAPAWLGIDRALSGWLAWRRTGRPVLVADAGTVLSLTRVDGEGCFQGGRLMAGLALQWRAMAEGTAALPRVEPSERLACTGASWPRETRAAMAVGVLRGLAAAIAQATAEFRAEEPAGRLVLAGGDSAAVGTLLEELLTSGGPEVLHWPDLPLEALVQLRPVGE
jgi:type III pantothenate kinase